eukprot:6416417-Prymnesium_polylepis.2
MKPKTNASSQSPPKRVVTLAWSGPSRRRFFIGAGLQLTVVLELRSPGCAPPGGVVGLQRRIVPPPSGRGHATVARCDPTQLSPVTVRRGGRPSLSR